MTILITLSIIIAVGIFSPDILGSLSNLIGEGINNLIALFQNKKKEVKKIPQPKTVPLRGFIKKNNWPKLK